MPANVDVSNRPGTAPVLVVYGDKDFTSATALETADSSGSSQLPELPHQKFSIFGDDGTKPNAVDDRLAGLFKLNKVSDNYVFDRNADAIWGMKADKTYTVQSKLYSHVVTTVNLYNSTDGNCYTALACNSDTGHIVIAESCRTAWDFMKHFSRNTDGTLALK